MLAVVTEASGPRRGDEEMVESVSIGRQFAHHDYSSGSVNSPALFICL